MVQSQNASGTDMYGPSGAMVWNTPAIDFYEHLGAVAQKEWIGYRLEGEALQRLAQQR